MSDMSDIQIPGGASDFGALRLSSNGQDMLTIERERFLVRGVPIPIDEQEATKVYEAFVDWLVSTGVLRR